MEDEINELLKERQSSTNFDSSRWQIMNSKISGKGVFAKQNFEPGDVIFQEIPLVTGPRSAALPAACVTCFKMNVPLEGCNNGCRLPVCSQECGNSSSHLAECHFLRSLSPKKEEHWSPFLYRSLTPVKCLLLSDKDKRIVKCLCANKNNKHIEAELLKKEIDETLSPDMELFFNLSCSVLNGTAFEVNLDNGNSMYSLTLRGLFPLAGMMNHCCSPNTQHYFTFNNNVPTMSVAASVPIMEGNEITTSYCPLLWSTLTRRQFLCMTKEFFCTCPRCQDPTEFGTYFSAHQCSCGGFILPLSLLDIRRGWNCDVCGKKMPTKDVLLMETHILKEQNTTQLHKMNYLYIQKIIDDIWKKRKEITPYSEDADEELERRENLIKEVIEVNDKLRLGNSRIKGNLLLELHEIMKQRQRRNCAVRDEDVKACLENARKIIPNIEAGCCQI